MRVAVIGDEISQDPVVVCDAVVRCGFSAVEVRSFDNVAPQDLTHAQLGRMSSLLNERGLEIAGFASPALKHPLPAADADIARARELLLRSVEQAQALGAPHTRIFTFYRAGDPDPATAAAAAAEVLAGIHPPMPLLVETGTRTNTPSVAHLMTFLDTLGRDDMGILWDPGNSYFSRWHNRPFPDEYVMGRERIQHVHVKDPDGQRRYVRLGDGDLPWPAILARLADDGYSGFVSLETHWRPDGDLSQFDRDEPWGERFSAGGLEASVECMRQLGEWFRQVSGS